MGKFFEALTKTGLTEGPTADPRTAVEESPKPDIKAEPDRAGDKVKKIAAKTEAATSAPKADVSKAQSAAVSSAESDAVKAKAKFAPIPEMRRLIPELVALHNPRSFEAEQFKLLRTQLLFPKPGQESPRTLMVTSALPGEGKSFVSANLAISIAQGIEEHVLLIDCDLRRPSIHQIFGYTNDGLPGLGRYLVDHRVPLQDVLVKTGIDKLTLLPAGASVANPAELLSSPRMMDLIDEARERYDDRYIIIDTPPPKMISEANAVARQVDGILLVIRYGKTPRDVLKDLVESLGQEKIVGTVMNRFDVQMGSLYGSYYNYRSRSRYYR